jgi:hypothetical protein
MEEPYFKCDTLEVAIKGHRIILTEIRVGDTYDPRETVLKNASVYKAGESIVVAGDRRIFKYNFNEIDAIDCKSFPINEIKEKHIVIRRRSSWFGKDVIEYKAVETGWIEFKKTDPIILEFVKEPVTLICYEKEKQTL